LSFTHSAGFRRYWTTVGPTFSHIIATSILKWSSVFWISNDFCSISFASITFGWATLSKSFVLGNSHFPKSGLFTSFFVISATLSCFAFEIGSAEDSLDTPKNPPRIHLFSFFSIGIRFDDSFPHFSGVVRDALRSSIWSSSSFAFSR